MQIQIRNNRNTRNNIFTIYRYAGLSTPYLQILFSQFADSSLGH